MVFKGYGAAGGATVALGRCERAIIGPFSDFAPVSTGDMPSKDVVPLVYNLQRAYRRVAWRYRGL
jgi:hypothetical protein